MFVCGPVLTEAKLKCPFFSHSISIISIEHSTIIKCQFNIPVIGPLQDPVTWYGINYAGTQMTQWDFQNKGTRTSLARLSFALEVPLRHLRPSVIYSVPCDRILQRAYYVEYSTNNDDIII